MFQELINFLRENMPALCQRCKRVVRNKNLHSAHSVTGIVVYLCPHCHKEIFHPWGDDDDD